MVFDKFNFDKKIYYYSNNYFPGYNANKRQEKKYIAQYPYINKNKSNIDLQVFYNLYQNGNNILPWGSSYKYTIPHPFDYNTEPSNMSISSRQRFRTEKFGNLEDNNYCILCFIIVFVICCFLYTNKY